MTIPKTINGAIVNDYQIIREIGAGAYGIVYLARHVITGQEVAIKCISKLISKTKIVKQSDELSRNLLKYFNENDYKLEGLNSLNLKLLSEFSSSNTKICSFIKEITIHLKVHDHPNVITIQKIIDSPICLFIIMDYFPEGDLFVNIVDRSKYSSDPMLIKKVFIQLIDVISYCHSKNIYHCDIKPENIMCSTQASNLYIGDFGLAVESKLINAKTCIGSSYYMPPERLISIKAENPSKKSLTSSSKCPFDHGNQTSWDISSQNFPAEAGDLWSLAIILINLTCTRNPWMKACEIDNTYKAYLKNKKILKEILPISDELYEILCLCLEKDPFKRITLFQLRELVIQCQSFTSSGPLSVCSTDLNDFVKLEGCDVPLYDNKSQDLILEQDIVNLKDIIPVNHIPLNFNKNEDGLHVDFINNDNWVQHIELFDNCSVMTNISFNMNCDMIEAGFIY